MGLGATRTRGDIAGEGKMSGAQSWSVKGIDPKVREAAREAAARTGHEPGRVFEPGACQRAVSRLPRLRPSSPQPARARSRYASLPATIDHDEGDDWGLGRTAHERSRAPRAAH